MSQALGTPFPRKEDPTLLSGRGRYADDLPVKAGTLHAHVLRSPHPHARPRGRKADQPFDPQRNRRKPMRMKLSEEFIRTQLRCPDGRGRVEYCDTEVRNESSVRKPT